MKSIIVVPARYASTRFPGKPLEAIIAGKKMIDRVYEIAVKAGESTGSEVVIATEDQRIVDYCKENNMKCVLTSDNCKTGTDRVCETVQNLDYKPDYILNLQGDAPLTPPWVLQSLLEEFARAEKDGDKVDMVTPGIEMTWEQLDTLREQKKTTPFSGTSIILDRKTNNAVWFSKNIIPAVRKEEKHRESMEKSPVIRHVGLYGYSYDLLMELGKLPEDYYEKFEGLEQLRALTNGYKIRVVMADYKGRPSSSGVDTPEDVKRTEALIQKFGELV